MVITAMQERESQPIDTSWLASFTRIIARTLHPNVPPAAITACLVALPLIYTIVMVHTPLAVLADAMHDDGLFMMLGRRLAAGEWLGPFNQYTLMKGPGYPAFLALGHWLGISASLAHALFHCTVIVFFIVVAHRFVGSIVLSGLLLVLLLWHPISMTAPLLRVLRDNIYYGQILLLLALLLCALFYASTNRRGLLFGALAGAVLGWLWLTREEGIWIIPVLGLVLAIAVWEAVRDRRLRTLVLTLVALLGVFAGIQASFRGVNRIVYGKFVGVDVKERNFERALRALASVRTGGVKPFVPITRSARQRVYPVSPTFASISTWLDTPSDQSWAGLTCTQIPSLCGEIAATWFLWALRDAAAAAGHYQSPTKASAFFGRVADEISTACAQGSLQCSPQLNPAMAPTSWEEIADRLPSALLEAYQLLILSNLPLAPWPSSGTAEQLDVSLHFLNYPLHTATADIPVTHALWGWYYRRGPPAWFSVEVRDADGSVAETLLEREGSPDLQTAFNDPLASRQRFVIHTRCSDQCVMTFRATDDEQKKSLAELRLAPLDLEVGGGLIHVDRAVPASITSRAEQICNSIRIAIVSHSQLVFLPLLALGVAAFVLTTALRARRAVANMCYLMALVSWVLVMSRVALLVLIDVTSFPALQLHYLAPAYFFLVCGAVFSCSAGMQLLMRSAGRGSDLGYVPCRKPSLRLQ
jgi:hypothetical protein